MGKLKKIIKQPLLIFESLGHRGFFNWMSDKTYLRLLYRIRMHKYLKLENPVTYNEKLQWLKLYDRKDLYTKLVDKYEVKKIVSDKIGEQYIVPTLGCWNNFNEINFDNLPSKFVLKCTHDSGGLIICKNKNELDLNKARKKIKKSLKHNYYYGQREWPYKNVIPRIIAEPYLEDNKDEELRDYKFFCFDGKVESLFIATDRNSQTKDTKFDFFDVDFNHLDLRNGHPNADKLIHKPIRFEEMKHLASKLSKGIPQVRVDFYEVNGKVYFGEMTFFHWSGLVPFEPEEWDFKFGNLITLPKKNNFE